MQLALGKTIREIDRLIHKEKFRKEEFIAKFKAETRKQMDMRKLKKIVMTLSDDSKVTKERKRKQQIGLPIDNAVGKQSHSEATSKLPMLKCQQNKLQSQQRMVHITRLPKLTNLDQYKYVASNDGKSMDTKTNVMKYAIISKSAFTSKPILSGSLDSFRYTRIINYC